jgi:transcriptional regulator GlxA family with amidase domain
VAVFALAEMWCTFQFRPSLIKLQQMQTKNTPSRRIVFLAYSQVVLLDLAGPWSVFHLANELCQSANKPYQIEVVTPVAGLQVETCGGLGLVAHRSIEACKGPIDTLVVPAAFGFEFNLNTLQTFRRLADRSRRVVSICGGAFLLAAAGLLDGRKATTHWRCCEDLAKRYPEITVEPDAIFVKDGNVYTSAGVTAGMDLALALAEEDLGRDTALSLAQNLVMFVRRPGGQTQFSVALEAQKAERQPLKELLAWITDHPAEDLSVETLAERVEMSPRNFSRVFRREIGKTPARFIEKLRLEVARQKLEESNATLEEIARGCGFGGYNSMRRSFLRILKVTPSDYRLRFRKDEHETDS